VVLQFGQPRRISEAAGCSRRHPAPGVDISHEGAIPSLVEPRWEIFHSNRTIWAAVLELCDSARTSLSIEQYIFARSGVGRRLLDVLTAKARQGVHVRLLVDAYGSMGLADSEPAAGLIAAGGEVRSYNRLSGLLTRPVGALHRLHRKSVICDGRWAMIGGTCYHDRMAEWRDTMLRLDGTVAPAAAAAFEENWRGAEEALGGWREGLRLWRYLVNGAPAGGRILRDALLRRIGEAERDVTLTTPYLVPDLRLLGVLQAAVRRGVRVRLLIPARSDQPVAGFVTRRFAGLLAARGVEAFAYEPSMMHAKLAVVDGRWALIGSMNLDLLSLHFNQENGGATTSAPLVERLAAQLEVDFASASRI